MDEGDDEDRTEDQTDDADIEKDVRSNDRLMMVILAMAAIGGVIVILVSAMIGALS
jgi:hypothetical protein